MRLGYFRLTQGLDVSDRVTVTTRSFNNMFEVPVLFYAACTLHVGLGVESLPALALAWLFVALRCVHALVHLTYNQFLHRMLAFWAGFLCVWLMWADLVSEKMSTA